MLQAMILNDVWCYIVPKDTEADMLTNTTDAHLCTN